MHEPVEPTPTSVEPDGSEGATNGARRHAPRDAGTGVFYASLLGAFVGIIAGGVFGLMTRSPGLMQIDDPAIFLIAVALAAVSIGMVCTFAWDAAIGAVTRSPAATRGDSTLVAAIVGSAAAAVLLMLVAQPLAGPIALLSIGLTTVGFVIVLIKVGITVMRRRG